MSTGKVSRPVRLHATFLVMMMIIIIITLGACNSSRSAGVSGQGAILYWHTELASLGACSDSDLVASLVPDTSRLEILRIRSQTFSSTDLVPPPGDCVPSPVQIAQADIDGDDMTDLVVLDSGCGNWIAIQSPDCGFVSHAWSDFLPDIQPSPWLIARSRGALSPQASIAAAMSSMTTVLTQSAGEKWQSQGQMTFPGGTIGQTYLSTIVQYLTDPASGTEALIFQNGQGVSVFPIGVGDSLGISTYYQQKDLQPQYVRPFLGFDQITIKTSATCGQFALGFGAFAPDYGSTPRRLQLIRFDPDGYRATELDQNDGYALASLTSQDGLEYVAMVVDDGLEAVFSLNTFDACQETLSRIGSATLAGQVYALKNSTTNTRLSNGLVFLTQGASSSPTMFTYDGKNAIACSASSSGLSCSTVERL